IVVGDENATYAGQYKVRFQPLGVDSACSNTPLTCGVARIVTIEDPPADQMCGFVECPVMDTEWLSFNVNDVERIAVTVKNADWSAGGFLAGWRLVDRTGFPVEGECGDYEETPPNFECGPLPAAGNPYRIEVGDVDQFVIGHAHVSVNVLSSTCETECAGDCDGGQAGGVGELLMLVNIALGKVTPSHCIAGDTNRDGTVDLSELIIAVNKALHGCSDSPPPFVAKFEAEPCTVPLPEGQYTQFMQCGYLIVPENRDHPEGRKIK